MNVKIDTKEKFTVITPNESVIPANMTEELAKMLLSYLNQDIRHIILNMNNVISIDVEIAEKIAGLQHEFYDVNASFIVCELQKEVKTLLQEHDLLDVINHTPTESEAWDILQMEEVERDLMRDFDNNVND